MIIRGASLPGLRVPIYFPEYLALLAPRSRHAASFKPASQEGPLVVRRIGPIEVINPGFDLKKTRVIVWDMDGTLYSQTPILSRFHEVFRQQFPEALREVYDAMSREVIQGTSFFRVGHSYDPRHRLIVKKSHRGEIVAGWTLRGKPVSSERLKKLYPEPIRGDEGIIHMDNPVKALQVMGVALGKTMHETDQAYFQARNAYFEALSGTHPAPGLPEFLAVLRERGHFHLVATLSDGEGARRMLGHLGILWHFHDIHTGVAKPHGLLSLYQRIMDLYRVRPDEILSVGNESAMDHVVPKRMGVQTLLIEEHPGQNMEGVDARVRSLSDLMEALPYFR